MAEYLIAAMMLAVLVFAILASIRGGKVAPETPVIGVRKSGKPWHKHKGSLLDARIECWDYAALETGDIVNVLTGYKTGKKIIRYDNVNPK
jgi:hypothetical protein